MPRLALLLSCLILLPRPLRGDDPAPKRVVTKDGMVSVLQPAGEGWTPKQGVVERGGVRVSYVQCYSSSLVLMAKEYVVQPKDAAASAKSLFDGPYKRSYDRQFESWKYAHRQSVMDYGLTGHEVLLTGVHSKAGAIQKWERVFVHKTHVFLMSAEGHQATFDKRQKEIRAFFASVRYSGIRKLVGPLMSGLWTELAKRAPGWKQAPSDFYSPASDLLEKSRWFPKRVDEIKAVFAKIQMKHSVSFAPAKGSAGYQCVISRTTDADSASALNTLLFGLGKDVDDMMRKDKALKSASYRALKNTAAPPHQLAVREYPQKDGSTVVAVSLFCAIGRYQVNIHTTGIPLDEERLAKDLLAIDAFLSKKKDPK